MFINYQYIFKNKYCKLILIYIYITYLYIWWHTINIYYSVSTV